MSRRQGNGRDKRQDAEDGAATPNHRVDRVYAPEPRGRTPSSGPNTVPTSSPPSSSVGNDAADTELVLRRQLSKLQRQLSEAQQEIANRDDELAREVEKRLRAAAAHEAVVAEQRRLAVEVEELDAKLIDAVTTAEELSHERDREREQRTAAQSRVAELNTAYERVQAKAKHEREELHAAHLTELETRDTQHRQALANAEEAITATTLRLREDNEDALTQLRDAHEEALAAQRETHEGTVRALRDELAAEADAARQLEAQRQQVIDELVAGKAEAERTAGELDERRLRLVEELSTSKAEAERTAGELERVRQRLIDELAAAKAASERAAAEREEAFARELAQEEELHESERTVQTRLYQSELVRAHEERDAKARALEASQHAAATQIKALEETAAGLRATQTTQARQLVELEQARARLDLDHQAAQIGLATAAAAAAKLTADNRVLREQLEASELEARRVALDRRRFVSYLEEGLAMLGPASETEGPDTEVTERAPSDSRDEPDVSGASSV